MWWWKKRAVIEPAGRPSPPSTNDSSLSKSASVGPRIALLIGTLEMGMCDDAILKQIFSELESAPGQLLPALMPKLAHTGFLLWKTGRGEAAARLLLTCLAWYLKNSKDEAEISSLTGNIQYMFEKEGRPLSDKDVHELAGRI
jgi:hypothetical protein